MTAGEPAPAGAAAIIVAAGSGTRFGSPDKVLLRLAGRPMIAYALDAAERSASITAIVVVAGAHTMPAIAALIGEGHWRKVRRIVLGGERRQDSVEAGLAALDPEIDIVAVHDAARPLVSPHLFDTCIVAARAHGAAIAALPLTDTLKRVHDRLITATIPRDETWAAQTPQAARRDLLVRAYAAAHRDGLAVTDEAGLLEAVGIAVAVVEGPSTNIKITRPEDLPLAEALLALAHGHEASP